MKKLSIDLEKCVSCRRCELACMEEHSDSKKQYSFLLDRPHPNARIFVESIDGSKPVPLVCRHCKEPLCVSACMSGAMQKDPDTGVVSNTDHEQKCVGCWMCVMVCPFGVITTSRELATIERFTFAQSIKCDLCKEREKPVCVQACPQEAIDSFELKEEEELCVM